MKHTIRPRALTVSLLAVAACAAGSIHLAAADEPAPAAPPAPPQNGNATCQLQAGPLMCQPQPGGTPGSMLCQPAPGPAAQQPGVAGNGPAPVPPPPPPNQQQPGYLGGASSASAGDVGGGGGLPGEVVGIKPQVGIINFRDVNGAVANRGVAGLTLDFNLLGGGRDLHPFLGISTGAFGSHIGSPGTALLGNNDTTAGNPGANLVFVPADAKLGMSLGNFRLGVHGGANAVYRSSVSSVTLGADPDASTGAGWAFLPNAGADLEIGFGRSAALLIRPDVTFGGSFPLYTGTVGLAFPIG